LGAFTLSLSPAAFGELSLKMPLELSRDSSGSPALGGRVVQNEYLLVNSHTIRAYQQPVAGKGGATGEPVQYTVQSGDTLSSIANDFNISINTILWENDLSRRSVLHPGDKLTILPESGVRHKVRSGESISGIAYNYGVDSETIIDANDLGNEAFIKAGEWLVIPGGEPPARNTSTSYAQSSAQSGTKEVAQSSYLIVPASGKNWGRAHAVNAADIANNWGTPVYAAAAGEITRAYSSGWHGGYGHYIKIRHPDGTETLYAHLNKLIRVSGHVKQGEQIATMGSTGNSTGPHLHFEVRNAYNPLIGPTRRVEALSRP
jgi:murein DD-endopeptidase MepM/ murein hydrolase activator NlpD